MNAKLIFGMILAGFSFVFIIQNVAVMELRFLFWTLSMSGALLMFLILAAGVFLGWLLHGSFKRRKAIARDNRTAAKPTTVKGVPIMKTKRTLIGSLVCFIVLFVLVSCSSTSKQASTGEYIDDSVITTKVKSLLAEDDFLKSFQISVETYKGVVQLSGFVNTQTAVDKAGQIASSVKGVQSVKNDLIVK
ncbi:MAG: lipopolysaccharide assembly protein LapA domain-containing protein [Desulfobacterales bacterium]